MDLADLFTLTGPEFDIAADQWELEHDPANSRIIGRAVALLRGCMTTVLALEEERPGLGYAAFARLYGHSLPR